MRYAMRRHIRRLLAVGGVALLAAVLIGCGPSTASNSAALKGGAPSNTGIYATPVSGTGSSAGGTAATAPAGPQYLIKSLSVDLAVKNTRQAADDLQAWISTTDSRSSTAGTDYQQIDTDTYRISITFQVQAAFYPQIERYLRDYAGGHGGQLLGLHEDVTDVGNDYIDTQSRLSNLRAEQQRLQDLLGHAQALSDVLSIEQRLTEVEGEIEQTEAHLNALNGQVTFYKVVVTLEPNSSASPAPGQNWNPLKTLGDAVQASLAFGQWVFSVLIWLVVFSVFVLPEVLIVWLVRRRRRAQA